jgi:hypothetical protein
MPFEFLKSFKNNIYPKLKLIVNNPKFILGVWLALALITTIKQYSHDRYNNYLIFKHVYFHLKNGLNLYLPYANEYQDTNHYGPFFGLLMAPFAILPNFIGLLLWQVANTLFLYVAIKKLPIAKDKIILIYWIVTHELLTALFSFQFNISITAIIILAYVFIEKKQNFWAAFVIVLGTFVKLYGIVGLAFFVFAKQKFRFISYCFFWAFVFLVVPMLFFSPHFVLQSYVDWYVSLSEKQLLNASLNSMQDISVMGMVRRLTGDTSISNMPFLVLGVVIFAIPYLRLKEYKSDLFRLMYLASTLIFTVIFSNSSESPTYIIAFAGVAVWFVIRNRPVTLANILLFIFALLLTSFSPSDLFPKYIRETYVQAYSLKALPCLLIWIAISYELIFRKFSLAENTSYK